MTHAHKHYANLKVKKQKGSEVEIEASIPVETVEDHRAHILEEMRKDFTAPGFRKGNVPMNIFLQSVNEMRVLEEAAELSLNSAYPEIVRDEEIKVFGRPQIALTKLAPKNPIEFRIRVGIIPEVKLPNYKKIAESIASEKTEITVSEEEINEVVRQIKAMRATKDNGEKIEPGLGIELTDEYVRTLGAFKDVADFKAKIKENLGKDKESGAWQKKRERMIKKLIDEAKVELPAIVVEDEANAIRERFNSNLEAKKMSKEDYLKKLGKTEEEVRRDDIAHIENELKLRLILDKMAEIENIKISEDEVEREMEYMTARHPESDPESLRNYIRAILRNEKLLRLLEGRGEEVV